MSTSAEPLYRIVLTDTYGNEYVGNWVPADLDLTDPDDSSRTEALGTLARRLTEAASVSLRKRDGRIVALRGDRILSVTIEQGQID